MDVHTCDAIREALSFIPADDRDTWLRMAMAVKSALGREGFDLWNEWSKQAPSYNARHAHTVWKSIRANGKVTIGTLFHEAKANGWRDDGTHRKLTPEELAERRCIAEERAAKEEAEIARERAEAASKAAAIWKAATPASADHPYISRKGVKAYGLRLYRGDLVIAGMPCDGCLIVPARDGSGVIHTLQFIHPEHRDGDNKRFSPGGATSGYYHGIGQPDSVLCIAEGFATAASIHEATGHAVAVVFTAGNLLAVAKAVRAKFPGLRLILCADDDYRTEGNPGLTKATEAARAVGALLAVPDFGEDRPEGASDCNDLARHRGPEAVRRCVDAAKMLKSSEDAHTNNASAFVENEQLRDDEVVSRCLADVQARPISWLWPGRIARGKLTVIAGHPGLGKSQLTASLAAIVSRGGQWPVDRSRCEPGAVVFLSAEDDAEDTIKPRLEAAGADLRRCYILDAVRDRDSIGKLYQRAFNMSKDLDRLGDLLIKLGDVRLVVIDPISAYLGATDSHKNAEVRALLAPLGEVAARYGAAFVAVSHLNKAGQQDVLMRVMGSLAFVAAARAAYAVVKDQDDPHRRLLLPLKNNIGNDETGYAFSVEGVTLPGGIETCRVSWESEPVTVTADEAMAPAGGPEERSDLDDCKEFLRGLLSDGPVPSKQVKADVDGAGHSWATVRRAQKALGIVPEKEGMKGPWLWRLPPKVLKSPEDAHQKNMSTFGENEHLRQPSGGDLDMAEGGL